MSADTSEGAPATEPAGALRVSARDPRDYNAEGLFVHGPLRAVPPLVRMIADAVGAPPAPAPHIARIQQRARTADRRRILDRHARFLAAVRGEHVGRNRRAA